MGAFGRIKIFLLDSALWLFWFPFRGVARFLPAKLLYCIAVLCSYGLYYGSAKIRALTYRELKNCLGDQLGERELRKAVRRSFEMDMKRRCEELMLGRLTKGAVEKMVAIEGLEHIDAALAKGKGVIILLSHFGSYLMVLPALGFRGYRINQIGGSPDLKHHRPIHRRIFESREKECSRLPVQFMRSDSDVRAVVRALQKNELVAIAFDGRAGKDWVKTKFLGRTAYVGQGPVRFAAITGAAILPTFIVRNKDNSHKLIIEKPFELEGFDDKATFISVNIQKLATIFAEYIRKYPCHFGTILSIHRRRADSNIAEKPFIT
jgi:lauroyl/myristoyl acyltransferase